MLEKIIFQESIHTFQIDFNHHVSNIVYIQWMEIGRLKLLHKAGLSIEQIDKAGFFIVLAETHIKYKRELFLGETVEVELWLSELNGVYSWFEFLFRKVGGDIVASAQQKCVFVDTKTKRPKRLMEKGWTLFLPFVKNITND
ncbi:MAG: acyl-CoA thioesterase [Ignavibacteriaceae bacterium]|jgi:acyl-CoA thioester hydrolase|nr:acyl-CoA thioesterase [Ignavibacteriaceae bacterium]